MLALMQLRICAALLTTILLIDLRPFLLFTVYTWTLQKLVLRAPTKSCLLDPIPTNTLNDCLDELLPLLSTTINLSLKSGFFPDIWKESVVYTTVKKTRS